MKLTSYLQHGKGAVHAKTGHEGTEVQKRYSSTLSLTSELDGVGGQRHAPAALPPGKTRYPLYRRLGPKAGLEGYRKSRPPPGSYLRTVQLPSPLPPVSVDISKQSICASTAPLNLNGTHTTGLIVTVTSARQSPTLNNAGAAISNQL